VRTTGRARRQKAVTCHRGSSAGRRLVTEGGTLRRVILGMLLSCVVLGSVIAGPLEDGVEVAHPYVLSQVELIG
jgi:hypothetical protein